MWGVSPGLLEYAGPESDGNAFFLPPEPQAQAFLGVLFTKEPYLDEQRAVKYLWLAANNGVWDCQCPDMLGIESAERGNLGTGTRLCCA